jgi:branched-chain amino acid transport system ATP-binding protein
VSSMLALLGTLADQGVGLCVVEHNMEVIRRLCTRVAFLANGRCLAVGEPDEIMARDDLAELFFGRPPNG